MSSAASFRKQSFKGQMMIFSWEKKGGHWEDHHRTGYVVFLTVVSSKSPKTWGYSLSKWFYMAYNMGVY